MSLPEVTIWMDPGGMTGLATYDSRTGVFEAIELPFQAAGDYLARSCHTWMASLAIGWERYRVDLRKPQDDANLAIEPIGLARYFATHYHCQILPSAAPGDRNAASMALLKWIGWWPKGKDAQSAAQHMVAWMLRVNEAPPNLRAAVLAQSEGRQ